MSTWRDTRGQATVLTVVFLTVLCGMTALVLDVGSWYRSDRQLQQVADAAALAGAQALPESTAEATDLAVDYAGRNDGSLDASGISFSSKIVDNDTIRVELTKPAPGFFAKLLGLDSVTVAAHAAARSANAAQALYVAPIVVNVKHPSLAPSCNPNPCQNPTQIDLADLHKPGSGDAAGSFGLINLRQEDGNGSIGAQELGEWIEHGFDGYLSPGDYYSVPSTKFNSSWVRDSMTIRKNTVLLFPIYDRITGPGDNAVYHIVGWVGFYVTDFKADGSTGVVYGHFTRRVSGGIQVKSAKDMPDFGVRVIKLVD